MDNKKPFDLFAANEEEVEVDAETLAAIDRGIKDADEGRTVSSDEVRKMIPKWIAKYASLKKP
jgi:predicted transcriptional regulator